MHRQNDRVTDRQTDGQTDRKTDRQTDQTAAQTHIQTDRLKDLLFIDRQNRQPETDLQTDETGWVVEAGGWETLNNAVCRALSEGLGVSCSKATDRLRFIEVPCIHANFEPMCCMKPCNRHGQGATGGQGGGMHTLNNTSPAG